MSIVKHKKFQLSCTARKVGCPMPQSQDDARNNSSALNLTHFTALTFHFHTSQNCLKTSRVNWNITIQWVQFDRFDRRKLGHHLHEFWNIGEKFELTSVTF